MKVGLEFFRAAGPRTRRFDAITQGPDSHIGYSFGVVGIIGTASDGLAQRRRSVQL